MCINDNPVARAMPYLISGIISIILTLSLYALSFVNKWNQKYIKITKVVMIIISIILLFRAYAERYLVVFKCG